MIMFISVKLGLSIWPLRKVLRAHSLSGRQKRMKRLIVTFEAFDVVVVPFPFPIFHQWLLVQPSTRVLLLAALEIPPER